MGSWIRLYPLSSFVAVADFELLDTAGLAPLSFVAVDDATVCLLSLLFNTHARERFDEPAAVSTLFFCGCLNGTMFRGRARLCLRSRLTYRFPRCYDRGSTVSAAHRRRDSGLTGSDL